VRSLVIGSPRATHWLGLEVVDSEEASEQEDEALASEQASEQASE
jgi:hypothetical protein